MATAATFVDNEVRFSEGPGLACAWCAHDLFENNLIAQAAHPLTLTLTVTVTVTVTVTLTLTLALTLSTAASLPKSTKGGARSEQAEPHLVNGRVMNRGRGRGGCRGKSRVRVRVSGA